MIFYFKIFKIYLEYLVFENLLDKEDLYKFSKRKLFLHLFKANYFIVISIKCFFLFINIISIILGFNHIFNIKKKLSIKIIKTISKLFSFYTIRLDELVFAVLYIQYQKFNEKTKFLNVNDQALSDDETYDAIIIGSGPSGSITANNLKKKYKKVLIVEKGNAFSHYSTKHPGDEFIYKWNEAGINTTILKNQISFSSGSCYGGGSEINSGLLHYPDKNFIEKWQKDYNVLNLNYLDIKKSLEDLLNLNSLISLQPNELDNNSKYKFIKGILDEKLKYEELQKFEQFDGMRSIKKTMSNTLLSEFKKNGGKVFLRYKVYKIYQKNNLWYVEGIKNNKKIFFRCKYLFICAGSIYTNQLIIENNLYNKLNKPDYFKFHPMIKVIAEYSETLQNGKENVHNIQITEHYPNFLIGQAASGYQFLKFAAHNNKELSFKIDSNWTKMSIYHSTFSLGKGKIYKSLIKNQFIYSYEISNSYLEVFKKAINTMVKVLYSSGAKNVYLIGKNIHQIKLNDLENFLSRINNVKELKYSSVHIMGGVKMGENEDCLVNSYGKFKNYKNLYVNDSSLINHSLLKNPQGTIMSVANRNIKHFLRNV